jgi:hypothetical protein
LAFIFFISFTCHTTHFDFYSIFLEDY